MYNKRITLLIIIVTTAVTAFGCSKNPVSAPAPPAPENTIGIEDNVIVSATGVLTPESSSGTQHTFNLSGVTIVTAGQVGDYQVLYTTGSSCDTDVEMYNVRLAQWDPVAIATGGICLGVVTGWEHLASEREYRAMDYLDGSNRLIVRSSPNPSLRAMEINPGYRAISLVPQGASAGGIEIVGDVLWLAGRNRLHRYKTSGAPQADVGTATRTWEGLAWDGENFWVANDGEVFSYSPQGVLQCNFTTPGTSPTAMTWLNGRLWLAMGSNLAEVNPVTSCLNNTVSIESTVPSPVADPVGLATDGTNFYVASPTRLYVMTGAGAVTDTYTFQVEQVSGIAYNDGGVWVVHGGPKGAGSRGQFLTRFLLRK